MPTKYIYNLGLQFYTVADQFASRTALRYPNGQTHSYRELNFRSNQISRYLMQNGVGRGDVVGILSNKSLNAFSLMLACLKLGVIYTNFDHTSPWVRLSKILSVCRPKMIFNDHPENDLIQEISKGFDTEVVQMTSEKFQNETDIDGSDLLEVSRMVNGSEPAYIMFTSGSTGFPKGAVMSHANVLNLISWGQETFSVTPDDIFTSANPIYFDNSVFDFYTSVFSGACLVPFSPEIVSNGRRLVDTVNETKCTFWFSVPSLLVYLLTTKVLRPDDFQSVKQISFGGEGFPKSKLKQLFDLYGHRLTLHNVYGPTECTCICSSYIISLRDFENMNELAPLGLLAPNFGYEILPLDQGNANLGELGLTGPNVGLGYYNDEERTNASFVRNPNKKYFQRMYNTGDVVEKRADGFLYFKGRVDNQVKHMGYRIELEEIEAAINSLKYVNETGVIHKKLTTELGQITAFVSLNTVKKKEEISDDIGKILPPYMVPKKIIFLEHLPKNRNGKIDRKQLHEL